MKFLLHFSCYPKTLLSITLLILSAPQFLHYLLLGALKIFSTHDIVAFMKIFFFSQFFSKLVMQRSNSQTQKIERSDMRRRLCLIILYIYVVSLFYKNYENKK